MTNLVEVKRVVGLVFLNYLSIIYFNLLLNWDQFYQPNLFLANVFILYPLKTPDVWNMYENIHALFTVQTMLVHYIPCTHGVPPLTVFNWLIDLTEKRENKEILNSIPIFTIPQWSYFSKLHFSLFEKWSGFGKYPKMCLVIITYLQQFRSHELLYKKGILEILQYSQENTFLESGFNKVAGLRPSLLKRDPNTGVFLWILRFF